MNRLVWWNPLGDWKSDNCTSSEWTEAAPDLRFAF